ncbi:MAG: SU10 major capsid protein [Bacteroidales bacterium]
MAVLKSFELKGNKQSFANWISNLSPCDTPFTSMTGKEGINEAQYSWQTDTLAAADNTPYEEGSQAVSQTRATTKVMTNFTSILRKVVNISDTVTALDTYGRNSEVAYQMGKSGKELKRDIEFMCLNNGIGNVGTKAVASKFGGFSALCAPDGATDPDTGAKTYKKVDVADLTGPWFRTSDLFDLTYNLYLSGSKANKIMFHPFHATTFSLFMSDNIETPLAYRMFDGLDDKFNTKVSRIRDPLGRVYDLIPNRFMPKDKIYIFNESDWTQMILRQPAVSPLSKQGSSERFLLETEIGLRHRHIHASGVMEMIPSDLLAEWVQKPTPLTWGIKDDQEATVKLTVRSTGALVPNGTEILWSSSNPDVIEITDRTGQTADGEANVLLKPLRAGTSVITAFNKDGYVRYLATVKDPGVRLTLSNSIVEKEKGILATVRVTKADGTPAPDGVVINFTATPGHLVTMPTRSSVTAGNTGVGQVEINAVDITGLVQVQASVDTMLSNTAKLEIVDKVEELIMRVDQRLISQGVNDSAMLEIRIVDATGAAIPNKTVSIISTDATVIGITHSPISTGDSGVYELKLTAAGEIGDAELSAQFQGQTVDIDMRVTNPIITLVAPTNAIVDTPFVISADVERSDNTPLEGVDVSFTSVPAFDPLFAEVKTDNRGIARVTYTATSNTDLEVTASAGNHKSATGTIVVGM